MNNLGKNVPRKCLKGTVGGQGGPPPPPGNRSIDQLKSDYGNDDKMVNTVQNASRGMVGVVNAAMQAFRTLTCILCAGPTDFPNIFDASGNIKINQENWTKFQEKLKDGLYRTRMADANCSALADAILTNITDKTKPGCSDVETTVKGRKRPNKDNACTDNATCDAKVAQFSLTNPGALMENANLEGTTVTDQSNTRMLRILQTATTVSSTGGVNVATTGDDDQTSYGGVSAFSKLSVMTLLAMLVCSFI